jgi:hypothetical protein
MTAAFGPDNALIDAKHTIFHVESCHEVRFSVWWHGCAGGNSWPLHAVLRGKLTLMVKFWSQAALFVRVRAMVGEAVALWPKPLWYKRLQPATNYVTLEQRFQRNANN